ncbi:MAG: PilZ domain-containing protein [Syntrophobacterales bacterium]
MREILQATEPLLSNSSVNIERRQCSRVLLGCPVMLTSTQGIMMGQIIDISLGGAFVCCKKPLNVKESLELTVKGVVVRSKVHCLDSDIKCHGMGVRFNDLSPESSRAIKGVVEKGVEV